MQTTPLMRVRNWGEHFECSQSRNLKRMTWVPIRVNLSGDGYTELLDHPNGAAHFGCWIALVEVGAVCEPRGTLMRGNGLPHDAESLSRITRIPVEVMTEAIARLLNIGWLEHDPLTPQRDTVGILQDTVASQRIFVATGQDKTVQTEQTRQSCATETVAPEPATLALLSETEPHDTLTDTWFDRQHDETFWPVYWRHVDKAASRRAFRKRVRLLVRSRKVSPTEAVEFLCEQARQDRQRFESTADWEWRSKLHPATWLNGERWGDEAVADGSAAKRRDQVSNALDQAMAMFKTEEK